MQTFKEIRELISRKSKLFRKEKSHSQEQAQEVCGLDFHRIESTGHDTRLTTLVELANYGSRTMSNVMDREKDKEE